MTAHELIDLLCISLGQRASGSTTHRDDDARVTRHAGFAGYPFADDGYEFMARATSQIDPIFRPQPRPGLVIWPDVREWPYVVFLRSPEERAMVEYCEGDLSVWIYDDLAAYQSDVRRISAERACP